MMSTPLGHLVHYLPPAVTRYLLAAGKTANCPHADRLQGALLFAEISGFPALTAYLAERGPVQAESIGDSVTAYFGKLMDLITAHGGETVEFTGDSMLVFWPGAIDGAQTAARRAAYCGMQMQARLQPQVADGDQSPELRLRVGIGAGEISSVHLGGKRRRRYHVLSGGPVLQVILARRDAEPGDVVVSPQAWELLQATSIGLAKSSDGFLLGALGDPLPLRRTFEPPVIPEIEAGLRSYLPESVLSHVDADKTDPLGELCQTTVLFFRLAALDVNGGLSHLQAMFEQLEDAVSYYEGIIVRLSAHESGIMAMAAFGLSPHAHRDDALRAVWAAMLAQAKIRHIGGQLGAGIASGQVFCGTVHNERRYEYIVMGDVVHVAAHLTQAAGASILCDTGTYLPARSQLTFEALPSLRIDNQPEPTPVYRHTP